jgi:hypothetical protein
MTKQNVLLYTLYKNNPSDPIFITNPEYIQLLIAAGLVNADGTIVDVPIDESVIESAQIDLSDSPIAIDVEEFTGNVTTENIADESGFKEDLVVKGDGIFDVLMNTATSHLKAQFDSNRLRGEDYATAYIQVYQATLQAALQIWLQKGIADKQLELLAAQVASEESKRDLYRRQIEGFDEDYKQKILKICMDSWAVGFSVARDSFEASGIPAPMQKVTIDDLYNQYVVTELDKYNYGRPIINKP